LPEKKTRNPKARREKEQGTVARTVCYKEILLRRDIGPTRNRDTPGGAEKKKCARKHDELRKDMGESRRLQTGQKGKKASTTERKNLATSKQQGRAKNHGGASP